jgi:hypothetical protein
VDKDDTDAEAAVDTREARDDEAAKGILELNLLLKMLLLPIERSDE